MERRALYALIVLAAAALVLAFVWKPFSPRGLKPGDYLEYEISGTVTGTARITVLDENETHYKIATDWSATFLFFSVGNETVEWVEKDKGMMEGECTEQGVERLMVMDRLLKVKRYVCVDREDNETGTYWVDGNGVPVRMVFRGQTELGEITLVFKLVDTSVELRDAS
jgi:hypothetical protein